MLRELRSEKLYKGVCLVYLWYRDNANARIAIRCGATRRATSSRTAMRAKSLCLIRAKRGLDAPARPSEVRLCITLRPEGRGSARPFARQRVASHGLTISVAASTVFTQRARGTPARKRERQGALRSRRLSRMRHRKVRVVTPALTRSMGAPITGGGRCRRLREHRTAVAAPSSRRAAGTRRRGGVKGRLA